MTISLVLMTHKLNKIQVLTRAQEKKKKNINILFYFKEFVILRKIVYVNFSSCVMSYREFKPILY